ncbi:hypothetical protein, partial [Frankia sp. AgW1.1]|uniref:hypothetical protein n=1 Tax=Frankia sp. AgW1.1 TaxID=1836971 RepID=UPI001EE435F7
MRHLAFLAWQQNLSGRYISAQWSVRAAGESASDETPITDNAQLGAENKIGTEVFQNHEGGVETSSLGTGESAP